MVAVRPRDIESTLRRPDPRFRIYLFYGPDQGQSADRAARLAETVSGGDPATVQWLDGDALLQAPERLAEEAHSQNLFVPVRCIRVRAPSDRLAAALSPVAETPPDDITIIVEAGDLKKGAALRKLAESSPVVAAIPAYGDTVRDLGDLVDTTVAKAGLTIEALARDVLIEHLGADHAVSRGEIEKLTLYCADRSEIRVEDVQAVCGDYAAAQFDSMIDCVADGQSQTALTQLVRLRAAGITGSPVLTGLASHFSALHRARIQMDQGLSAENAIKAALPRIHFSRQGSLTRQLRSWPGGSLRIAMQTLRDAARTARFHSEIESTLVERTVLQISEMASRRRA